MQVKPPVLHMPNEIGRFYCILILASLQLAVHFIKYRVEKPKLTAYASKRLQEAMQSYSITKLELCSLAINIASFSHLLKKELILMLL